MFPIILGMFKPLGEDSGPVLLCPYVMDSQPLAALGFNQFDTFSFDDGVFTGVNSSQTSQQVGGATVDLDQYAVGSNSVSLVSGSGKVAFEVELADLAATGDTTFDVRVLTVDFTGGQVGSASCAYLGNLEQWNASLFGQLVNGSKDIVTDGQPSVGDRVGIVIDTDTGGLEFINSKWHENFGGSAVMDLTHNAGFQAGCGVAGGSDSSTIKGYTKASDMALPYPPGTKDTCGNAVSRTLVTYPLVSTPAELATIGASPVPTKLASQLVSIEVPANTGSTQLLGMGTSFANKQVIDLTKSVAFEAELTYKGFTGGAGANLFTYAIRLMDAGTFAPIYTFGIEFDASGFGFIRAYKGAGNTIIGGAVSEQQPSVGVDGRIRIGVLYDGSTGELSVWGDGVPFGMGDITLPANTQGILFAGMTRTNVAETAADGLTYDVRLITDPYWFTTPFPAGSVAIDGVTPADTVKPSPESFFTAGDVGGLWHTKYRETLSQENSDPVLVSGDDVYTIASAVSTPTTVAIENTQPYDAIWRDNYMDSPDGVSIFRGDLGSNNHSRGVLVMGLVKYTTAPNVPGADAFWINNHNVPLVQFQDAADGTGMIIKPRLNSSTDYITAALNDGLPHTVGWDFNPSGNLLRFIVDGVVVGTAIANITTQNWGRVALTVGDRDGLDQDSWALFVRDRVAGSPEEIQALHDLMVSGLVS